jgi:prepilin-type N-terminal cleavage/methylation domain-containing protein
MRRALRNTQYAIRNTNTAFTLVEVMTALVILAIISSSVLVVINRCMASSADSALRMQAFEVARDNMEALLSKDSVNEMAEFGSSVKYPEIQWKTIVEVFYEAGTEQIWVRAICSAEYTDTAGEVQTIELTHWLTGLTKEQLIQMIEEKQKEKGQLTEEVIETVEEAAGYAGVDVATIQQWVEKGMPKAEDGFYIKDWLNLYARTNGEPTVEDKERLAKGDVAREELLQMSIEELYQLLLGYDQVPVGVEP